MGFLKAFFPKEARRSKSMPTFFTSLPELRSTLQGEGSDPPAGRSAPSAPPSLASGRGRSLVSAFAKMCHFTQETSAAQQK